MAVAAQIASYLLAVILPVAILSVCAALFGWKAALAVLIAPIAALWLYGLVKAPK